MTLKDVSDALLFWWFNLKKRKLYKSFINEITSTINWDILKMIRFLIKMWGRAKWRKNDAVSWALPGQVYACIYIFFCLNVIVF